jgi:hypothetical protein
MRQSKERNGRDNRDNRENTERERGRERERERRERDKGRRRGTDGERRRLTARIAVKFYCPSGSAFQHRNIISERARERDR